MANFLQSVHHPHVRLSAEGRNVQLVWLDGDEQSRAGTVADLAEHVRREMQRGHLPVNALPIAAYFWHGPELYPLRCELKATDTGWHLEVWEERDGLTVSEAVFDVI